MRDFLRQQPLRLKRVLSQASGLPVQTGSCGLTQFNRTRLNLPKTHALDAACVGRVGGVQGADRPTLQIRRNGRGSRSRTRVDKDGFPVGYLMREKTVHGVRTGDRMRADRQAGRSPDNMPSCRESNEVMFARCPGCAFRPAQRASIISIRASTLRSEGAFRRAV